MPCATFGRAHTTLDRTPKIGLLNEMKGPNSLICQGASIPTNDGGRVRRVKCNCAIGFSLANRGRTSNAILFHSPSTIFCLTSPVGKFLKFTHSNCLSAFECGVQRNRGVGIRVRNASHAAALGVSKGLVSRLRPGVHCFDYKGSSVLCFHALIFPLRRTKRFGDQMRGLGICGCYGRWSIELFMNLGNCGL